MGNAYGVARNICIVLIGACWVLSGCGKGKDAAEARQKAAAEARQKAAASWENKMRRDGMAGSISTRGDASKVLVVKWPVMEGLDLCTDEFMNEMAKGPPAPNSTEFGVAAMNNLGFNRYECEADGRVIGVDLPYVAKVKPPLASGEENAKRKEDRRRVWKMFEEAARKNGSRATFDVGGDDGSTVVIGTEECSQLFVEASLSVYSDLSERGHKRLECNGPNGTFGVAVP